MMIKDEVGREVMQKLKSDWQSRLKSDELKRVPLFFKFPEAEFEQALKTDVLDQFIDKCGPELSKIVTINSVRSPISFVD